VRRAFALAAVLPFAVSLPSAAGTMRVTLDDRMNARPIEGYVWFVGFDRARPVLRAATVTLRGTGRHVPVSYIRSCDGNCGFLDPPSKHCSRTVTLRPAVTVRAVVRLLDSGCRILVR
jgi:hypothetical protein